LPRRCSGSGACQSDLACSGVNQFPSLTPSFLTPLTRRIPAAKSALRRPQSAASYARRRTAPRRRLIVPGPRCRDSKCIRYRTTTVLLNDKRGSEQYHSTNSSIAWRQPRWASGHERLSITVFFATARSGSRRIDFACVLFLLGWVFVASHATGPSSKQFGSR
jgi:hypothetical protein